MIGCLVEFPLSSLTASPRLLVNTFKHTLRGGIILWSFSFVFVAGGVATRKEKELQRD
jgi:hypothetical protein